MFISRLTWYFIVMFLISLLLSDTSSAVVWEVTQQWDEVWENQYSEWITNEVDESLLVPLRVAVDCADLCYVVRAIFARNHLLPFLASDLNGVTIGQHAGDWDGIPIREDWRKDKRFRAFIIQVVRHVTTKSYPHDTYPVSLSPATVKPGLVLYENIIASHACFIGRIDPEKIIPTVFFESSVPPTVRFKRSTNVDIYIYEEGVSRDHSGIVRWNWPVNKNGKWRLIPDEKMPHYSLEIYDPEFPYRTHLSKALNRVVKEAAEGKRLEQDDYIQELIGYFQSEIEFRCKLVKKASSILTKKPQGFRSEDFDYTYNTDSRDERLRRLVRQIWAGINEYEIPRERFFQKMKEIPISISARLPETNLYYLFIAVDQRWNSSDAYVSIEKRWGVTWDETQQQWIFNDQYTEKEVLSWYRDGNEKDNKQHIPTMENTLES